MYRTEFVGENTLERITELIPAGVTEGVLVTGSTSYEASGADERIEDAVGIELRHVVAPSPNPALEQMESGFDLVDDIDPGIIIGIGGGSVIDTAKALSVLSAQPENPTEYITEEQPLVNTGKPLIAVPTTAGTGSETTHFATIYIQGTKYSLAGTPVYPMGSIVDPTLVASSPQRVRATAGVDALSQAIESYWSINSTPASRLAASRAIERVWKHIEQEVSDPTETSRSALATAAHLSGKAIDVSKTTACHSVSYPMTANFDVAHGAAVALTVPAFLRFNARVSVENCTDPRGSSFVSERITDLVQMLDADDAEEASRKLTNQFDRIGLPTTLQEAGVDDIETVIAEGFTPERMGNNPRQVNEQQLRDLLETISH